MPPSFSHERENKLGSLIENCDADESRFSINHKIGLNLNATEKVNIFYVYNILNELKILLWSRAVAPILGPIPIPYPVVTALVFPLI